MSIVSIGFQDKTLQQLDLANPEKDADTQAIIKWRCEHFKLPEAEIRQLVEAGKPRSEAITVGSGAFGKHVGNEKLIVTTYQSSIQDIISRLYPELKKQQKDLDKLEGEGKHKRADRTLVNIPPHAKLQQTIIGVFAWILVAAGIVQLAIFLHNQNGMEWWQAFVVPFSGVVGLSWAVKFGLTQLYSDHYAIYKTLKYVALLLGVGCLVAWVLLYSQYAVALSQGPQFTTLDGGTPGDAGGHGSQIMVALQILGEAFVAGFLFTVASEITAKYTTQDGIDYTEEYKHDKKEVEDIERELEFANSRKAHTDSLLSMLATAQEDAEAKSAALWGDFFKAKS